MISCLPNFFLLTVSFAARLIGLASLLACASATAVMAAPPPGVGPKLVHAERFERLWSGASARMRVIVELDASTPDEASPLSSSAIDRTSGFHSTQILVVEAVFGSTISDAESEQLALRLFNMSPMFAATVTAEQMQKLTDNSKVIRIHEDVPALPSLDQSVPLIGMPPAYAEGATGTGWRVALLDTGLRTTHEMLPSVFWYNCFSTASPADGTTSMCPVPRNNTDCDPAAIDGCGHGTHSAAIIAGRNKDLQAGEPANGVARDSGTFIDGLVSVAIYSTFPASSCPHNRPCLKSFTSDQISGLEWAYFVHNSPTMSRLAAVNLGLSSGSYSSACDDDPLKWMVDRLREAGIATVVAAGNNGSSTSVGSPACISSVISVAASTKQDTRSGFSNWDKLVDLVAPGSDVVSAYFNGDSSYATLSGTSVAAAHVSGAITALKTLFPNASVSQVEQTLASSGHTITSVGVAKQRIQVDQAILRLKTLFKPPLNDNFANRTVIPPTASLVTGTNAYATFEAGEPIHSNGAYLNSVWWSITPTESGRINLGTAGTDFPHVFDVYTGTDLSSLNLLWSRSGSVDSGILPDSIDAVAGTEYIIAITGQGNASGKIRLTVDGTTKIVSAVSPTARATTLRKPITAFVTVLNAGSRTARQCRLDASGPLLVAEYSGRNPVTGAPENPGVPIDIPAGGRYDFVLTLTPYWAFTDNVPVVAECSNAPKATNYPGINEIHMAAMETPPADVIAIAVTATNDGIANIPIGKVGFAALAAINIGAPAKLQARLSTGAFGLWAPPQPLDLVLCQTNPANGDCLAPPTPTVDFQLQQNQTATLSAFMTSTGVPIDFDPVNTRLYVHFYQGDLGVGAASVALRSTPAGGPSIGDPSATPTKPTTDQMAIVARR